MYTLAEAKGGQTEPSPDREDTEPVESGPISKKTEFSDEKLKKIVLTALKDILQGKDKKHLPGNIFDNPQLFREFLLRRLNKIKTIKKEAKDVTENIN